MLCSWVPLSSSLKREVMELLDWTDGLSCDRTALSLEITLPLLCASLEVDVDLRWWGAAIEARLGFSMFVI